MLGPQATCLSTHMMGIISFRILIYIFIKLLMEIKKEYDVIRNGNYCFNELIALMPFRF